MDTLGITLLTLEVGLVSLAVSFVPGLALAWLLAKKRFRGRTLLQTLVNLPMVVPPVAVGLVLLLLLGRRGALGGFLHRTLGIDILFTWQAAALASAVMAFPLLVRSAQQAFAEVPERLENVAASLGAGPFAVFRTVTLPLARARRGLRPRALLRPGPRRVRRDEPRRGIHPRTHGNPRAGDLRPRRSAATTRGALGLACVSVLLAFTATYLSELYLARRRGSPGRPDEPERTLQPDRPEPARRRLHAGVRGGVGSARVRALRSLGVGQVDDPRDHRGRAPPCARRASCWTVGPSSTPSCATSLRRASGGSDGFPRTPACSPI